MLGSIPNTIHTLWIGSPIPDKLQRLVDSIPRYCPTFHHKIWRDEEVRTLPTFGKLALECEPKALGCDLARAEIIHREGGIFVDADMELTHGLDYARKYPVILTEENHGPCLSACFYGAVAGHPLAKDYMERLQAYVGRNDIHNPKVYPRNGAATGRMLLRHAQKATGSWVRFIIRNDQKGQRWFVIDRNNYNVVGIHYAEGTWK